MSEEELNETAEDMTLNEETPELTRQAFEIDMREVDKDKMQMKIRAATKNPIRGAAILPSAFDFSRYKKNPVIMWAHNYDLPAIGKALWNKADSDGLLQLVQFAKTQFASELFYLYSESFMSAWSIGWSALEVVHQDDKRFKEIVKDQGIKGTPEVLVTRAMLYETSAVPLPADPDALTLKLNSGDIHSASLVDILRRSISDAKLGVQQHAENGDDKQEVLLRIDTLENKIDEMMNKFSAMINKKETKKPEQKKAGISASELSRIAAEVVSGEISRIKGRIS
jgi:hypothetical protein